MSSYTANIFAFYQFSNAHFLNIYIYKVEQGMSRGVGYSDAMIAIGKPGAFTDTSKLNDHYKLFLLLHNKKFPFLSITKGKVTISGMKDESIDESTHLDTLAETLGKDSVAHLMQSLVNQNFVRQLG